MGNNHDSGVVFKMVIGLFFMGIVLKGFSVVGFSEPSYLVYLVSVILVMWIVLYRDYHKKEGAEKDREKNNEDKTAFHRLMIEVVDNKYRWADERGKLYTSEMDTPIYALSTLYKFYKGMREGKEDFGDLPETIDRMAEDIKNTMDESMELLGHVTYNIQETVKEYTDGMLMNMSKQIRETEERKKREQEEEESKVKQAEEWLKRRVEEDADKHKSEVTKETMKTAEELIQGQLDDLKKRNEEGK